MSGEGNGWNEWKRHVLAEISSGKEQHERLMELMTEVRMDIVSLQTKAAVWGAVGASIPIFIGIVYQILSKK